MLPISLIHQMSPGLVPRREVSWHSRSKPPFIQDAFDFQHPIMPSHIPSLRFIILTRLQHVVTALLFSALGALPLSAITLDEVVGTWKRADSSLMEFSPDGTVLSNGGPIGRWERLPDSKQPIIRLSGVPGYSFLQLAANKRTITVKQFGSGATSTLERKYDGQTINPDVPAERAAYQMERTDLESLINKSQELLRTARREAYEEWNKYNVARLHRRSASRQPALNKDAEVKKLESRLSELNQRLSLLNSLMSQLR